MSNIELEYFLKYTNNPKEEVIKIKMKNWFQKVNIFFGQNPKFFIKFYFFKRIAGKQTKGPTT